MRRLMTEKDGGTRGGEERGVRGVVGRGASRGGRFLPVLC